MYLSVYTLTGARGAAVLDAVLQQLETLLHPPLRGAVGCVASMKRRAAGVDSNQRTEVLQDATRRPAPILSEFPAATL